MDIEGTCKDMIRAKWSCSKTCWNLSSLCEEWVVVAATEAEKPLRWKRKHFLTDIFKLKNTNPHSCTHRWAQRHTHAHVFILISKAKEAASIFISCWSLSQREGERDEIRYQFVWFFFASLLPAEFQTLSCHLHLILSESFKRLSRQSLFLRLSSLYPALRNSSHPWKTQTCRFSQTNFSLDSLLGVRDNIQS